MVFGLRTLAILAVGIALASCSGKPDYQEAPTSGDEVRFSLSDLEEGIPVFHSLEHEGTRIDYFVLKIDGRVESYFDACAKCYPQKKGYRAEKGEMVCVACGQRFPMRELEGIGSCHPLPIEGRTEDENYVIYEKDILKGARYF